MIVRVFLAERLRCAQVAASSPDLISASSAISRSLRAADWSGGRIDLVEGTGDRPPFREGRSAALARGPFEAGCSDSGGSELSFGRTLRSGASRSSSPAIPTSVNRAYRRA